MFSIAHHGASVSFAIFSPGETTQLTSVTRFFLWGNAKTQQSLVTGFGYYVLIDVEIPITAYT